MTTVSVRRFHRTPLIIGIILLATAAILANDAYRMASLFTYGISPGSTTYVVSIFIAILGAGHFVSAFRGDFPDAEAADWRAVGWVAAGLLGLMVIIFSGAGFIFGAAALFALTARAFGRRALIADIAIGLAIALLVFFLFNNLLSLSLPQGPLERLF